MSKEKKKGRFRPVRFVFGVLGSILAIIILIPFVMVLLMFDFGNYQPPIDDWTLENQFTFGEMVSERIDAFLANETEDIDLTITVAEVNALIISTFRERNQSYLMDDSAEGLYAIKQGEGPFSFGLRGITAYISDDILRVDAGLHLIASFGDNSFIFRTRLRLDLHVVESVYGFTINIQRINISNLPLLPFFGIANRVLDMLDINLEQTLSELITFGTLNYAELKFSVTYDDIFGMLNDSGDEDEPSGEENTAIIDLLSMLATQTFGPDDRRLFDFGLRSSTTDYERGELALSLNLGLFRSNLPSFILENPITSQDELDNLFAAQISNMLFSTLVGSSGDLFLDLREMVLNQIVQYMLADGDAFLASMQFVLGEDTFTLEIENPFIEVNDDAMVVKMFMTLTSSGENNANDANTFRSLFTLTTAAPKIGGDDNLDLILTITGISLGDFTLESDMIETLLSIVQVDMIQGNSIIIQDFAANIVQDGISLDKIYALPGVLRIYVQTEQDEEISAIVEEVQQVLPKVLDDLTSDDGPLAGEQFDDVREEINNLSNQLNENPEDVNIDDLVEAINSLPNEDKQTLLDALVDSLGEHMDSDLLDLIPNFDPSSLPSFP